MIVPSTLNFIVVGCFVVIFSFLWRAAAARMSERPIGQAMASIL